MIFCSGAAQALVTRVGVKPALTAGMLLIAAAQLWFTRLPVTGTYAANLLPGFLVVPAGLGLAFVSVGIASLQGVRERDAGLASGLINTSQQVGGAIGIAVTSTIAASHTAHLLRSGASAAGALTSGFHLAFAVVAAFAIAGAALALTMIRRGASRAAQADVAPERAY